MEKIFIRASARKISTWITWIYIDLYTRGISGSKPRNDSVWDPLWSLSFHCAQINENRPTGNFIYSTNSRNCYLIIQKFVCMSIFNYEINSVLKSIVLFLSSLSCFHSLRALKKFRFKAKVFHRFSVSQFWKINDSQTGVIPDDEKIMLRAED